MEPPVVVPSDTESYNSIDIDNSNAAVPEKEMTDKSGSTFETVFWHCVIHPSYTTGGHVVGHHSHSRVEASDMDVPEVPKEYGAPDKNIVDLPCKNTSEKGGMEDFTISHRGPCGVDFSPEFPSKNRGPKQNRSRDRTTQVVKNVPVVPPSPRNSNTRARHCGNAKKKSHP